MPKRRTSKYPDVALAKALWRAVKVSNSDPRRRIVWQQALVLVESRGQTCGGLDGRSVGLPPVRHDDPDMDQRQQAINAAYMILGSAVSMNRMADDYRQGLADCARFFGGSPASDWQDVQRRLLEIKRHGEAYTSLQTYADRLKCAKGTAKKALDRSAELRQWRGRKVRGAPKAQSLTRAVTDNTPSAAPSPAGVVPNKEADRTFRMLLAQVGPEKRKELLKLGQDERRKLARSAQEQADERYAEEDNPRGNRFLGRRA